jgi:hypothetical protein
MIDHKCQFAELIGQSPKWQTDDDGLTVCVYCHVPKNVPAAEPKAPVAKTARK